MFLLDDLNCKIQGPRYNFSHDRRSVLVDGLLRNTDSISLHVQYFSEGPIWTFQSYEDGPKTVIDHIVTQRNNICDIVKVYVPEENLFNVSDHKPVICAINLQHTNIRSSSCKIVSSAKVSWSKAIEKNVLKDYTYAVSQHLWTVTPPGTMATPDEVESYYKTIVDAMIKADNETLPRKQFVKHVKPYWNKVVDSMHMRQCDRNVLMRTYAVHGPNILKLYIPTTHRLHLQIM